MNVKTIKQNKLIITTFLVLTLIFLRIGFVDAEVCLPPGGDSNGIICQSNDTICAWNVLSCSYDCQVCSDNKVCRQFEDRAYCVISTGECIYEGQTLQKGETKCIGIQKVTCSITGDGTVIVDGHGCENGDKKSNFDMKTILIIGGIGLIVYALFSGNKNGGKKK